jgi:hypothetical protein
MKNVLLIALALVLSTTAQAGVGILGGASFHSVSDDNTGTSQNYNRDRKLGFIGGLAFSSNFMLANVELDVLYDHRTLNIGGFNASSPAINVPLMARISLVPAILDLGVGPYASFNVGSNSLGYDSPDFGAVGSVRVAIPLPIRLVLDARYNWGFSNLTSIPGLSLHTREFQLMAGIDVPLYGDNDHGDTNAAN